MIHLHNGDSVAISARRALLPGRHLAFHELMIAGPVRAGLARHDWIEERAHVLAEVSGENLLRTRNELLEQEQLLDSVRDEDEVILWFEHDLFCLVHLVYLLNRLAKCRRLSLVWSPRPLGVMPEDELVIAYDSRAAVAPAMTRAAAEAWKAYTAEEATALNAIAQRSWPDFPFLREGFLLHAMRFPNITNGLGEVERRAMTAIDAGATDFASAFGRFDPNPPRYGFGDGEFLRTLRRLATCAVPMLTITEMPDAKPPKALFALTAAGGKVLAGESDFIDLNNAGFWLGGAQLTRTRMWRYDAQSASIVATER